MSVNQLTSPLEVNSLEWRSRANASQSSSSLLWPCAQSKMIRNSGHEQLAEQNSMAFACRTLQRKQRLLWRVPGLERKAREESCKPPQSSAACLGCKYLCCVVDDFFKTKKAPRELASFSPRAYQVYDLPVLKSSWVRNDCMQRSSDRRCEDVIVIRNNGHDLREITLKLNCVCSFILWWYE